MYTNDPTFFAELITLIYFVSFDLTGMVSRNQVNYCNCCFLKCLSLVWKLLHCVTFIKPFSFLLSVRRYWLYKLLICLFQYTVLIYFYKNYVWLLERPQNESSQYHHINDTFYPWRVMKNSATMKSDIVLLLCLII